MTQIIHFSLFILLDCLSQVILSGYIGGVAGIASFRCAELFKKFSSQSEWCWWGFSDIWSCSSRRGHEKPKPIKHKEAIWYLWTKPSAMMSNHQVKQGFVQLKRIHLQTPGKSFSFKLLDRIPSLCHDSSFLFTLQIFQLMLQIWLR
jgi:hypothetical protein